VARPKKGVRLARVSLDRATEVEKFDQYARSYREAHRASVRLSGEDPEFFAEHKIGCLKRAGVAAHARVLDYGCGTGSLTRLLGRQFADVAAYDPSKESLVVARAAAPQVTFHDAASAIPGGAFDVAILSGVLHHVAPAERRALLHDVVQKLAPGGTLFVFEHNPYNPVTRRAVRDCPFDDDAILLEPRELRQLLAAELSSVQQDYVLFFPRFLARLRRFEPLLRRCPLGAQTLTSGVRAESAG
jgi:2-polyprenyl-3-methyl-5-hydroxy-6-metoxy-1,4-benzoquinol methylase